MNKKFEDPRNGLLKSLDLRRYPEKEVVSYDGVFKREEGPPDEEVSPTETSLKCPNFDFGDDVNSVKLKRKTDG